MVEFIDDGSCGDPVRARDVKVGQVRLSVRRDASNNAELDSDDVENHPYANRVCSEDISISPEEIQFVSNWILASSFGKKRNDDADDGDVEKHRSAIGGYREDNATSPEEIQCVSNWNLDTSSGKYCNDDARESLASNYMHLQMYTHPQRRFSQLEELCSRSRVPYVEHLENDNTHNQLLGISNDEHRLQQQLQQQQKAFSKIWSNIQRLFK